MILLQCSKLGKSFGGDLIFKKVSFILEKGERMAIVGSNGAGKSTLLKCLVGEEVPDEGFVSFAKNVNYGYLPQIMEIEELELSAFDFALTAFQDLINLRKRLRDTERKMSDPHIYNDEAKLAGVMKTYAGLTSQYELEGGYTYEARTKEILTGLGFQEEEWERSVATFSGGQKTRLGLARLLARSPELLILDEPTNYLDLQSLNWLENYLKQYPGGMLIVSHDRYFLDAISDRVMELDRGRVRIFSGNYTQYAVKKAQLEKADQRAYLLQEKRIKRLNAYVERYREGIKARQARGRAKQLEKITPLEEVKEKTVATMGFVQGESSGYQVLTVKNLTFGYTKDHLFENLEFNIYQGDRIALIGKNGTGKTTLLKIILAELHPEKAFINFGARVKYLYFSQEGENLNDDSTVFEEIQTEKILKIEEARSHLARFLFKNDDLDKKVKDLSGGEKSRLALAKLMLMEGNFLILDEPTNHLDMETRQVLEDALEDYPGTILMVSHDRYLINQIANQVWELKDKKIDFYLGDYDYYLWKKEADRLAKEKEKYLSSQQKNVKIAKKVKPKKAKTDSIKILEEKITEQEERLHELTHLLAEESIYQNPQELIKRQKEFSYLEKSIEELYEEWGALAEKEAGEGG